MADKDFLSMAFSCIDEAGFAGCANEKNMNLRQRQVFYFNLVLSFHFHTWCIRENNSCSAQQLKQLSKQIRLWDSRVKNC